MKRARASICVCGTLLATACEPAPSRTPEKPATVAFVAVHSLAAAAPPDSIAAASLSAGMLRLSDLPAAARAVLRDSFPTFEPYDPARYSQARVDSSQASADEGLMIVRGQFRKAALTDYVVAGMRPHMESGKQTREFKVIALLAKRNGTYRPSVVSEGTYLHSGARDDVQQVLIELDGGSSNRTGVEFLLINLVAPFRGIEHWVWVPSRNYFLLDEPEG
jgi:hypothetical protein